MIKLWPCPTQVEEHWSCVLNLLLIEHCSFGGWQIHFQVSQTSENKKISCPAWRGFARGGLRSRQLVLCTGRARAPFVPFTWGQLLRYKFSRSSVPVKFPIQGESSFQNMKQQVEPTHISIPLLSSLPFFLTFTLLFVFLLFCESSFTGSSLQANSLGQQNSWGKAAIKDFGL